MLASGTVLLHGPCAIRELCHCFWVTVELEFVNSSIVFLQILQNINKIKFGILIPCEAVTLAGWGLTSPALVDAGLTADSGSAAAGGAVGAKPSAINRGRPASTVPGLSLLPRPEDPAAGGTNGAPARRRCHVVSPALGLPGGGAAVQRT